MFLKAEDLNVTKATSTLVPLQNEGFFYAYFANSLDKNDLTVYNIDIQF